MSSGQNLIQRAIVGMALSLFVGGGFAAATAAWVRKSDYAVRIDGKAVDQLAYHRRLAESRQLVQGGQLPADALHELAINQLIERELLMREATRRGLSVPESEVEAEWQQMLSQFGGQNQRLRDQLQRHHYSPADFRQEMQARLLATKVREAIAAEARVKPGDIEAYYKAHPEEFKVPERIEAAHMLFKAEQEKPDQVKAARAKAETVLKELTAGGDFAALAKKHSQDEGSKDKGGKLEPFAKGDMDPAFEAAAWKLAPGAIAPAPVQTPYGWHLIQRGKTLPAGLKPLSEVKAEIEARLREEQGQREVSTWLQRQRQQAKIEINPGLGGRPAIPPLPAGAAVSPAPGSVTITPPQSVASPLSQPSP